MAFPVTPVSLPSDLIGQTNGKLDARLLSPIDGGGKLHHLAARAWRALVDAARREAGLPLTYTYGGDYRSYASQEALFRTRYTPGGPGGGCKSWNGQLWCKKSANLATAAVPGTSNHGWGLAVDSAWDDDLADGVGPDDATAITSHPGWKWLLANAHRFGWSWELQSEPWHLRYVAGNSLPPAVLQFENPTPQPPPPIDGDDDVAAYLAVPPPERAGKPWLYVSSSVRPATTFDVNDGVPARQMADIPVAYRVEQYDALAKSAGL